jgi:hypothetical protein
VAPALLLALAAACAPRVGAERRSQEVALATTRFRVVYWPEDAGAVEDVRRALEVAAARVERWGGLRQPVTILVHRTHADLEAAAQRPGYDWLHAWARYDTIDLQSPRTWGLLGASGRRVQEVLTHELTHCAMYQLAGDERSWMGKQIPRWFSEGLASVTAGQERDHAGLRELWAFYQARVPAADGAGAGPSRASMASVALPGDPVVDPDPIYQRQSEIVYGAAHQAVTFLLARYGERRVRDVLRRMGAGKRFPSAFREAIGIDEGEFAADFRHYVIWQGWRR